MAKYIKTEEGYKSLNEVEGAISMVGENYIEIKENIIRTTFGDPAKIVEQEPTRQYCDQSIKGMEYYATSGMYCSSPHGLGSAVVPPNNGEILEIKMTDSSGNIIFDGEAIYQGDSTGGYAECQDNSRIVFSDMYASTGGLDIVVMWTTDISNAHLKMTGKKQIVIDGYVTLPKTALNYDDAPTENSDNLLTSGVVYTTIQDLQSQIAAIPKTEILTSEEQDFSDESVLSSAFTMDFFSRIDERLSGIENNVSTTLSDYSLASDLIGGAK